MKEMARLVIMVMCVATVCGCRTYARHGRGDVLMPQREMAGDTAGVSDMAQVRLDRMLIWKADLNIQVWTVSNAVSEATALVERQGGFVAQKSEQGDESASLVLRPRKYS